MLSASAYFLNIIITIVVQIAEMLWNQVSLHKDACAHTIQVGLFTLLSLRVFCWGPAAEDATLYFASGNEQLVQEYPRPL